MINEFLQAIQFLTRLPLGKHANYAPGLAGAEVSWYAPTGLIIGVLMVLAGWILDPVLPLPGVGAVKLGKRKTFPSAKVEF